MMSAGMEGLFDMWMYEKSDLIQSAAKAHGERLISEQFLNAIGKADPSLQPVLETMYKLYAVSFYSREQWTYGPTLLPSSSYLHTL